MRLTIAVKLAFAAIATVVLCVGTMAWVISRNIETGFLAYLNALQAEQLSQVADVLADQYRLHGDFEWLRENPRSLSDLVARRNGNAEERQEGPPDDAPPPPRLAPPPPAGYFGDDVRPPPESAPPPRPRPPPPRRPPPADMLGFGSRLTLLDADGRAVIGPIHPSPGSTRTVSVDGRTVATLILPPLQHIPASSAASASFLREQSRTIAWLAGLLIVVSALLAIWLSRRLLRPVGALQRATADIARGKLGTRVAVSGRDELATLAEHVNEMAQALDTNERQRRKLLADVSHELRTPLSVVRGEIEAMQDGIRPTDARALASLHQEVLHVNKLVDDLHQLALADAGHLQYRRSSVDLAALAADAVRNFEERAARAGLQLVPRLPPGPLTVHADPGRLMQVLTNLLENSIRYTDRDGSIVLSLRQEGKHAELCVEDSAPGVPDGMHKQLFDRLSRVDEARSRSRGGSGLGLSICKTLVEAHDGSIIALPSSLGGLKIVAKLPLTPGTP